MNSESLFYFYGTVFGRTIRRLIRRNILNFWKRTSKQDVVVSVGYGLPYLRPFYEKSPHCINLFPQKMGAIPWPAIHAAKQRTPISNRTNESNCALIDTNHWPLQESSVDRLLIVHCLEHAMDKNAFLNEAWRVLAPSGKMILIVPNRHSSWSRKEDSPFGQGTPYSYASIIQTLDDLGFKIQKAEGVIHFWPLKLIKNVKVALALDTFFRRVFRRFPGVWMIESTKRAVQPIAPERGGARKLVLSASTLGNARKPL